MAETVAPIGTQPISLRPQEAAAPVQSGAVPRAAVPGDAIDTSELNIPSEQIYRTTDRLEDLRLRGVTGDDPATKPSFWQKAAEIFDFILGAIPGIGQFVHLFEAIVGIGRLCYQLLSGENREQIDWTKELARIGAHLLGTAFPLVGSIGTAILNYWFDASENRQGVQVFGGLNYYMGDEYFGRNKRGVVRDTLTGARQMLAGVFQPTQQPPAGPGQVTEPTLNGPPQQGVPRSGQPAVRFAPVA